MYATSYICMSADILIRLVLGKLLRLIQVGALCALGLLLSLYGTSSWVETMPGAAGTTDFVKLGIYLPAEVYADVTFDITLQVNRTADVIARFDGWLYHENQLLRDFLSTSFDTSLVWMSTPIPTKLSAGTHILNFTVKYGYVSGATVIYDTISKIVTVTVESRPPSYTVIWLQKPEESIRAGKLIRLRFSIRNETSGLLVLSDDVRIVVEGPIEEPIVATCGRRSGSIRINTDENYYRWYWKTKNDLPAGVYSVIVLLDGAELGPPATITIVSKT